MPKFMLSTFAFLELLSSGRTNSPVGQEPLSDLCISAVSVEWISAEIEHNPAFHPADRVTWRTNHGLLCRRLQAYGNVVDLGLSAIGVWGQLRLVDLSHADPSNGSRTEMPLEERFVVATAIATNQTYVSPPRDWNVVLQNRTGLSVTIV